MAATKGNTFETQCDVAATKGKTFETQRNGVSRGDEGKIHHGDTESLRHREGQGIRSISSGGIFLSTWSPTWFLQNEENGGHGELSNFFQVSKDFKNSNAKGAEDAKEAD
jgi:hypothetical protein